MNLWSALELGKTSIMNQQKIFQIVGHNMANVNTPGYSRQSVQLENVPPPVIGINQGGRGMNLIGIHSVRDRFINGQIVDRQQYQGKYETLSNTMANIEALFDESNGLGISDGLTGFFNDWATAANQPTDIPTRNNLVTNANSFCQNLNNTSLRMTDQQEIFDANISDIVDNVNEIAIEIASLNEKIAFAQGSGQPANDLLDLRENRLKDISRMVGTNIYYNSSNNSATVEVAGRPLVSFNTVNSLSVIRNTTNHNYNDVYIDQYGGTPIDITSDLENGSLDALITMRDVNIPKYKEMLDNFAFGLAYSVNSAHQTGFALDTVTTDQNFFEMSTGAIAFTGDGGGTTTLNFAAAIDGVLHQGDAITINGQTRIITAPVNAGDTSVTVDTAFTGLAGGEAWGYLNHENAASNLTIEAVILADSSMVALSGEVDPGPPASGSVGNNEIALEIAALMDANDVVDTDNDGVFDYGTLPEYLHSAFAEIGNDSANAQYEKEANGSMLLFLENRRDEISGVSLDEEAADLIQYEKTYQAVAQFMGKINGLLDVLMSLGR